MPARPTQNPLIRRNEAVTRGRGDEEEGEEEEEEEEEEGLFKADTVNEEEEESLFKTDAVNEEGPERDRASPACGPPHYDPKGDSPLFLHATGRTGEQLLPVENGQGSAAGRWEPVTTYY